MENKGKALITGASTGIGAVYADRLAKRGYDLILVARDHERLQEVSKRITAETGRKVEILKADLTSKEDLRKVETTLRTDEKITLLLNNAGMALGTKLVESDVDKVENLLQLNITALTRLTAAIAPRLFKQNSGTIINIASVVALAPEMLSASVYGASKSFVLTFTQGLRSEFGDSRVQIQAVLPGATSTEIWERSGMSLEHLPKEIVMSAGEMVDAALVGLDRKELITIPSLPDQKDWESFESARKNLGPNLSRSQSAPRYGLHS